MIKENIEKPSGDILKRWADLTYWNSHMEVREEIAKYFGDDDRAEFFHSQINRTRSTCVTNDVTRCLLDEIKEVHGKKMANLINKCL